MIDIHDLQRFHIFKELTESELESIREKVKIESYKSGVRLFAEKSLAENLYLILDGRVDIRMSNQLGDEMLTVDSLGPGEAFGWSAVADPHTFTAAAWTMQDSRLAVLRGDVLRSLFKLNNQLGYKITMQIAAIISKRLRQMGKQLAESLSTNQKT